MTGTKRGRRDRDALASRYAPPRWEAVRGAMPA
jgi:hypothetical protein